MNDNTVEEEIVRTAQQIGTATAYEDLFDSQLSFWLSVQALMRSGGYEAVCKRMSFVSEDLAEAISTASLKTIRNLCSAEISTIKPSLPDTTIIGMLSPRDGDDIRARMVLQLLAESKEEIKAHD